MKKLFITLLSIIALNSFGQTYNFNGKQTFKTTVGIGTYSPSEKLDINGQVNLDSVIKFRTLPIIYKGDSASYSFGISNLATDTSYTFGRGDTAYNHSLSIGFENIATDSSFCFGIKDTASAYSSSIGLGNYANNYSTAVGLQDSVSNGGVTVGNANRWVDRSIVVGTNNTFIINGATVVGDNNTLINDNSIVLGRNLIGEVGVTDVVMIGEGNSSTYQNGIEPPAIILAAGSNIIEVGSSSGTSYYFNPISIKDGSEGDGKVFTSDVNGVGSWQTLSKIAATGQISQALVAATTITVTISTQPSNAYQVSITPTNALSAALFYVTNKTTTSFDVMYLAGITGTVAFDYALIK